MAKEGGRGGGEFALGGGQVDVVGVAEGEDLVDVVEVVVEGVGVYDDVVEVDFEEWEVAEDAEHQVLEEGGGGGDTHGEALETVDDAAVEVVCEKLAGGVEGHLVITRFQIEFGVVLGVGEVLDLCVEGGVGLLEGGEVVVDLLEVVYGAGFVAFGAGDEFGG